MMSWTFNPFRLSIGAGVFMVIAAACRPPQPRPLAAASVVGCYEFSGQDGRQLESASGFWSALVRLDTLLAPIDGDGGYTTRAGYYSVMPTARIPVAAAMDTALFRSTWEVRSPDTLLVTRSTGLNGQGIRMQPQGRDFVGVEGWFNDVIDSTRAPSRDSVIAKRVPCPAAE